MWEFVVCVESWLLLCTVGLLSCTFSLGSVFWLGNIIRTLRGVGAGKGPYDNTSLSAIEGSPKALGTLSRNPEPVKHLYMPRTKTLQPVIP